MPHSTVRRSRVRRAGESAYGLLLVLKNTFMALLALLLMVAGAWASWDAAQPAMRAGVAERGTLVVEQCGEDRCRGVFAPEGGGARRDGVWVAAQVADGGGERLEVALLAEGEEAVRTDAAGVLFAWVPLAGGLLLASLVLAGGLRMRRTGWVAGLLGAAVMVGAFVLL
ncbi:hypothetical protein RM572_28260 [Streptomyces sp. DSM 42041]|uniref:Integral membrane protein n=1 Tax=Streptomyces hazeniae TaxID=3075538 RepID=A0ABU2P071_9ACTN|nr:hypothetical protein [Streptomyces sp. DSM 42041]MDT0382649.1 hypothetical protein [Streptomyces sp. DSM 42041]